MASVIPKRAAMPLPVPMPSGPATPAAGYFAEGDARDECFVTDDMDDDRRMRSIRYKVLEHMPFAGLMSIEDRKDFYDGRCRIRVFDDNPILDYTRPWGTSRG